MKAWWSLENGPFDDDHGKETDLAALYTGSSARMRPVIHTVKHLSAWYWAMRQIGPKLLQKSPILTQSES